MIHKEKLCIQLALNAKAVSAQRKLTMLKLKIPDPEDNIPEFLRKKENYEPTPKETKKAFLSYLSLVCLVPL